MSGRVCVVVVTFNRRALLQRCLAGLEEEVRDGDAILVVDNASTDGTRDLLGVEYPHLSRLDLPENVGGAGGFHAGMKWAHERGFDWLWLMDDDGVPEKGCLDQLRERADGTAVLVPVQRDSGGRFYGISDWRGRNVDITDEIMAGRAPRRGRYLFTFVGPLIPRAAIDQIGLPYAEFFIWFDDGEYSLRLGKTAIQVELVPDALFRHDMGQNARVVRFLGIRSVRSDLAAWKIYYGVRNQLFTLIRSRRPPKELLLFGAVHARLTLMDAVYGPQRGRRIGLRLRGAVDGILGRLGKRVPAR